MAERTSTFWRSQDWRVWRYVYLTRTPEAERLAWICPADKEDLAAVPKASRALARIQDISLGGVLLLAGQLFEPGTLLKIDVEGGEAVASIQFLGRVIQAAGRAEQWLLSCCFARELSAEELGVYGAERRRPTSADKRAWVRFPCNAETVFHCLTAADHEKQKGKILDISPGGVGLAVERRYNPGDLLSLELADPNSPTPRCVQARVLHVKPRPEGGWLLGCTFVSELGDDAVRELMT